MVSAWSVFKLFSFWTERQFVRSGILVSECVLSFSSVSLMPASFDLFLRPVYVCSVDVLSCTVCTGVGFDSPG